MLRDRIERWIPAVALLVVGALFAKDAVEDAGFRPALVVGLAVLLAGGWWVSPMRRGRHVRHARARAESGDEDLIVYWKPGCSYCIRLLATLDRSEKEQIRWVNVWRDADAAQFVADHNDGNVLTPTVMTGTGRRLSMTAEAVRAHLADQRAG